MRESRYRPRRTAAIQGKRRLRVNGSCVKIPSPLDGLVLGKLHLLALPLAMDHRSNPTAEVTSLGLVILAK